MTNTVHAKGGICPSLTVFFMRRIFKEIVVYQKVLLKGLFKRFNPALNKMKRKEKKQSKQ